MNKLFFFMLVVYLMPLEAKRVTPQEILKKADEVRNPSNSFVMNIKVASQDKESQFQVFTKGSDKTLIKTISPRRDRGRNILMLGTDMWIYLPNLKNSVRVALNQKLFGEVANGDISRMRWFGDYIGVIKSENDKVWVLDLNQKKKGLTYSKLQVTVEKKTFHPLSAIYKANSGKPLKTSFFKEYKMLEGKIRPSVIQITDELDKSKISIIRIVKLKNKKISNSLFSKERLKD